MKQLDMVSGFSELKDLLIRTYKIERDPLQVRLYFSVNNNQLIVHDYDDHKNLLILSRNITKKAIGVGLTPKVHDLVEESLNQKSPSEFLIKEFQLNGFFRS